MRTHPLILLLSALSFVCLSLLMLVPQTAAQTELVPGTSTLSPTPSLNYSHVIVESAFLRGGPGLNYVPVGALYAGNRLTPLNCSTDAEWVLVAYYRNTAGWIRRDLGFWFEDIDSLPVRTETDLTPTFMVGRTTGTPFFYPTETPSGNYVLTTEENAIVRTGPGLHYDAIGFLSPGVQVIPVGRNLDSSWVLLRVTFPPPDETSPGEEGFAWIARTLVYWTVDLETLPILTEDNLTPTLTATDTPTPTTTLSPTAPASPTPTATTTPSVTASATLVPSLTATPSHTLTDTPVPTATETPTASPTATTTSSPTPVPPTATPVPIPTSTPTPTATNTPTDTATATLTPSLTDTPIPTATETPTASPTATMTSSPTPVPPTATPVPMATTTSSPSPLPPTDTITPSATDTATAVSVSLPTDTPEPSQTSVEIVASPLPTFTRVAPTDTATSAPTATETATLEPAVAVAPTDDILTPGGPGSPIPGASGDDGEGLRPETIVGGLVFLLVVVYIGLYLRGLADVGRYEDGFVVDRCPVCQEGTMQVEIRQKRVMGIPRPKRIVRCSVCRSVLRETGYHRWRYAVDPLRNPAMYERFNGCEVDEQTLAQLLLRPVLPEDVVSGPVSPPSFVEGEEEDI